MRCTGVNHMVVTGTTVTQFLGLDFLDEHELVLPLLTVQGLCPRQALYSILEEAFKRIGYTALPTLPRNLSICMLAVSNAEFVEVIRSKRADWVTQCRGPVHRWAKEYFVTRGSWPQPRWLVGAFRHLP